MSKFEAQGDPKVTSKCVRKSKCFLNAPRWVVLRKTFYYSKIMGFEDPWFQKSEEIIDKCDRKAGPKKGVQNWSKNEQHLNPNGSHQSSTFFQKHWKKGVPKPIWKKGAERNRHKIEMVPNQAPSTSFHNASAAPPRLSISYWFYVDCSTHLGAFFMTCFSNKFLACTSKTIYIYILI